MDEGAAVVTIIIWISLVFIGYVICTYFIGGLLGRLIVQYVKYKSGEIKKYFNKKIILNIFLLLVLSWLMMEIYRSDWEIQSPLVYGLYLAWALLFGMGVYSKIKIVYDIKELSFSDIKYPSK